MTWNVILYKSLKSDECLQFWFIFSARHFYRKYQASRIAAENIPIRRTWNVILYKSPKLDSLQCNTIQVYYCFSPYLHFAPLFVVWCRDTWGGVDGLVDSLSQTKNQLLGMESGRERACFHGCEEETKSAALFSLFSFNLFSNIHDFVSSVQHGIRR